MPQIEKDCHSFTIKAEREKYREMMNLARQASKGATLPDLTSNGLVLSKQMSTGNKKQLDNRIENKTLLQPTLVRTRSQQEKTDPLQENLSLAKSRSLHREPPSHALHTMKSDSTLDTDGHPGSRIEERTMNFSFILPPLMSVHDRSRYGDNENMQKKTNQPNLSELEKISKKVCTEETKKSAEPKVRSQANRKELTEFN